MASDVMRRLPISDLQQRGSTFAQIGTAIPIPHLRQLAALDSGQ